MIKFTTLLLTLLLGLNLSAEILDEEQVKAQEFFLTTIPLIKNLSGDLQNSYSIQKEYFNMNDSILFNKSVIPFYTQKIEKENFTGFTYSKELIYIIPELNNIFKEYLSNQNPVSLFKIKQSYKDKFYKIGEEFSQKIIKGKQYYSETPLIGVSNYDFKNNSKSMIFSNYNKLLPAVYFECYENGDMIGIFNGNQFNKTDVNTPSYSTKVPIILEVPEEIKKNFTYHSQIVPTRENPKNFVNNLCVYKRQFSDLDEGEKFVNLINNSSNSFITFFTMNENVNNSPFLSAKVTNLGFFELDPIDYYHSEVFNFQGSTYNDDSSTIIERQVDLIEKDPKYNNQFLSNNGTYSFGEYYIRAFKNNKIFLKKEKTNLLIEYDYVEKENEIILTLNNIIKDSPTSFPLKIRIIQEPNSSLYDLQVFELNSDTPSFYSKIPLNLRNNFSIKWDIEVKK